VSRTNGSPVHEANKRRTEHPMDHHVIPAFGRKHTSLPQCWCVPYVTWVAESGAKVWIHREDN
jgi:hypothetical protein